MSEKRRKVDLRRIRRGSEVWTLSSIIQRSWVSEKPETKRPSHWLQHYRGLSIYVLRLKPCFNFLEPLCGASCESVNMAWPQVASDLPSAIAIELDSVRCEGAVYVTVSFFFSLVSECNTLHSLRQAMDIWTRCFIRVWFHARYWSRERHLTWGIVTDTRCRGQQDSLKPLLNQ